MKRVLLGIATGGAAAAALFGSATAHADGETWIPSYGVDTASLVQAPGSQSLTWELPATFTGTGTDTTTLSGTDYLTPSAGGFNNEFVTGAGAVYDQDQLGGGFTNLYYDPDPGATGDSITDVLKTPFGNVDVPSSLASYFAPTDPSSFLTSTDALGNAGLYSALDLGPAGGATEPIFTPVYGAVTEIANNSGTQAWELPATFTPSGGTGDATALSGTDYLTPSAGGFNNEFVTSAGAIYDQDQLFQGVTNLYYDPSATGTAVDMLKTPLGEFNISSLASLFTPTDYTDGFTAASPVADLSAAGLYSALDLGLPAADASSSMADLLSLF